MNYELSDYLASNCRSFEQDCDNENDTDSLASHLHNKFPNISYEEIYKTAKEWTGLNDDEN